MEKEKHVLHILGLVLLALLLGSAAHAKREVEQLNLPQPRTYANYKLLIEASQRRVEVGEPVVFKATLVPGLPADEVEYQFLINGAPIAEPGMHKVHTFKETGTYRVSAVAKLGNAWLINSAPLIIHVIDAWVAPEAIIAPQTVTVKAGEPATFNSLSEVDPASREWLYWSLPTGHRGAGKKFVIRTEKMEPGKYPVQLLLRDDRKRESTAEAFLIVAADNEDVETLSLDAGDGQGEGNVDWEPGAVDLNLHASHKHRMEGMQVVFWLQNAQPGANTLLQLDPGDNKLSGWSRRLRYGHAYHSLGIYTAHINAKTPSGEIRSNPVRVYVWPFWLPVLMIASGVFLAGIPFFRRRQRKMLRAEDHITFRRYPDPGHHQLILQSGEESPALHVHRHKDTGRQTLNMLKTSGKSN